MVGRVVLRRGGGEDAGRSEQKVEVPGFVLHLAFTLCLHVPSSYGRNFTREGWCSRRSVAKALNGPKAFGDEFWEVSKRLIPDSSLRVSQRGLHEDYLVH